MSELLKIALANIRVNPVALRDVNRKGEGFTQLVDSVRLKGVMNPINVRRKTKTGDDNDGKEFELIDGLQRFTASLEVGSGVLGEAGVIPAQVIEASDAEALENQIIANAHKIETRPVEYAKAMMRLLAFNPTWTENQLAVSLAKSPGWVGKQLGLLKLADAIKPLVDEGKIPVANAFILAKMPQEEQANWIDRAMTQTAAEFSPSALERVKQLRDANRAGTSAAEETYTPTSHLRNKKEIEEALKGGLEVADVLLADVQVPDVSSAKAGFELGVKWVLNLDPKSVEAAKAKYEADKAQRTQEKAQREAERQEKRSKELAEKQAEANQAAAAARAKINQDQTVQDQTA